jgi:tRNA (cmo5U34)-methyltransferase
MTIQELFNRSAARYDLARRQLVPCFDDFYAAALERLPAERDRSIQVLDLGAGTGLLAALVAAA